MNKMVLLVLLCAKVCFAGDRVAPQMPVLFVMAANAHNPVPCNERKLKHAQPRKPRLQQKQKYSQQNKPNIKQPKRGY